VHTRTTHTYTPTPPLHTALHTHTHQHPPTPTLIPPSPPPPPTCTPGKDGKPLWPSLRRGRPSEPAVYASTNQCNSLCMLHVGGWKELQRNDIACRVIEQLVLRAHFRLILLSQIIQSTAQHITALSVQQHNHNHNHPSHGTA
jgi:hypothetical protein